jgi:hypothetical protein
VGYEFRTAHKGESGSLAANAGGHVGDQGYLGLAGRLPSEEGRDDLAAQA